MHKRYDLLLTDSYLNAPPHSKQTDLISIRECGIKQIQYNMEVYGYKKYTEICPGKTDYHELIKKYMEAVDVFGRGNVRSNFVLGIQPIDELIEGVEILASIGVVSDYSIFQPKRGTKFGSMLPPSIDTVVEFTKYLADVYSRHSFKPIYCSLSSRSSIINEIYYG